MEMKQFYLSDWFACNTVAPELEGFSTTAHHWAQIEANYSFFRLPQAHSQTGLH
jgi:hypothetical protein